MNKFVRLLGALLIVTLTVAIFNSPGVKASTSSDLAKNEALLASLTAQVDNYKKLQSQETNSANQYAAQIAQLQTQIQQTQNQIASLNSQISSKENSISSTETAINDKIAAISTKTDQLNKSLVDFYMFNNSSTLGMTGAQTNLSNYADQSQYLQILQQNLLTNRDALDAAKKDLDNQMAQLKKDRDELAALKGEQLNKNATLLSQQNQSVSSLSQAKASSDAYGAAAKKLTTQRDQVSAAIFTLRQQLNAGSYGGYGVYVNKGAFGIVTYVGQNPGYAAQASGWGGVDPWQFYTGQCVSYGAWKLYQVYHKPFFGFGRGDAYNWPNISAPNGYSNGSTPRAGSAIAWGRGFWSPNYGHVAYVESVNSNGTINVSEYNYYGNSQYDTRINVAYNQLGSSYTFIYP